MTKKELLENDAFMRAPDDAELIVNYCDDYGDHDCTPDLFYNKFSNILYLL